MKVYTDGGSRGNPGKASCAFIVVSKQKIIKQKSKFLKIKTNNEAEYNAIIFALENIKQKQFEIISDSELVIKQITGEYKINKSHLALLNQKVQGLISTRKIKFSTVKRENKFISFADELVNKELDKY
jgi:ribonuclease HI